MSTYTPDAWALIEVNSKEYGKIRKILAGWRGGYLDGDCWKLSSGILKEYSDGDFIVFPQESGSIYRCHKDAQRLTIYTGSILQQLKDNFKDNPDVSIELIEYKS